MQLLTPQHFFDYELIDSGGYEKLERFGKYILRRPEPQAVWRKSLPEKDWEKQAGAHFKRNVNSEENGEWRLKPGMPEQWFIEYGVTVRDVRKILKFRLGLTAFKHVGIFPEQAVNWDYITDRVSMMKQPQVLNLFAYTGGASLAAKAAGADVTHVDSVRQVLNWSRENMETSGLNNIRWVLEDALKFAKREVKRRKIYQGIVLDPPAYGRGPAGERWILEEDIAGLMNACSQLLDASHGFCVLNLYSMGFSSLIAENLVRDYFPALSTIESGEVYVADQTGRRLPLGIFCRGHL